MAIETEQLKAALESVIDPEVGINIVDLGLVYDLAVEGHRATVTMTMTTPACPLGAYIRDEVDQTLHAAAPELEEVAVELVWEPPWSPEKMSDRAKAQLGWDG